MEFMHACPFCGWSRESEMPVLVPAGCPSCGCPADSLPRSEALARGAAALAAPAPVIRSPRLRVVVVAFALLFLVAAARVGYGVLELNGAIIAVGAAGFLLLPFVPERLGAPRRA